MNNKSYFLIFIILSGIDAFLTIIGIEYHNMKKINPLMNFFMFNFSYLGIIFSKIIGLIFFFILIKYLNNEQEKIFCWSIILGLILVIINNLILILR